MKSSLTLHDYTRDLLRVNDDIQIYVSCGITHFHLGMNQFTVA